MTKQKPNITIIGAGYVGLSTAAILSNIGYKVHLIELNQDRLNVIKTGKSFFFEEGINPLIENAINNKALLPTDEYEHAIKDSHIIFSCVGTPDNPDGSSNLSYVFAAAETTSKHIQPGSIYVQKSTVPVGTGQQVEQVFKKQALNIHYVSNPEFLREGTAVSDTLFFDRVVAGGSSSQAVEAVLDVYRQVEANSSTVASIAQITFTDRPGNYIHTNLNSAELIKVTANAFLALKISFANSIAKLADQTSADINQVMDAVGADRRIGRAFLNAGRGYGGGCFPKDVSGLISSANQHGLELDIMNAVVSVNESMPGYIVNKAEQLVKNRSFKGKKVAVLGLAFKAGTSDARKSPGVKIANSLSKFGAKVSAFDPEANGEAKEDLRKNVAITDSLEEAVQDTQAVFIATEWPQFLGYDLHKLNDLMEGNLFVDCMNRFDPNSSQQAGLTYVGVGR